MIKKLFGQSGKSNKPKKEENYKKISRYQCQCSGSSQIPSQDDLNYHQFLSLYKTRWRNYRSELIIYDTENKKEEIKILDAQLDTFASITQLPSGELFCYGSRYSGVTLIIDRNYGVRMLPSGTPCWSSSALYFDNNVYCFGGYNGKYLDISRKFDLETNRWTNLASLPKDDHYCNSVVFNGNILFSERESNNIWLYSIEIDSFSILPYDFAYSKRKLMINIERLYLIEWDDNDGWIYESEDEYHWKPISNSGILSRNYNQMYCLYNKEKIYISTDIHIYEFDLKRKGIIYKIK